MSTERLEALRGTLIVSVQPDPGSALDPPETVAALAACALANGAAGVRIAGAARIAAVRARSGAPIIGISKRQVPGFETYITATLAEAEEVLAAGATIVAADATARPRPDGSSFAEAVGTVHRRGGLAMADCATLEEARAALEAGADILATTLCGYTPSTRGAQLPALSLTRAIAGLGAFTICEGGIANPQDVKAAFEAGADAIVVGTAITNIDLLVRRFAGAVPGRTT